ncbi:hypothetical protein OIU77_025769 [Salix suchowensis]|uniref:Uncharacterized protein n=1 Tax=Salix suchowensis TaxID=1278906 RepID=A0ABQ9BXD2_9ROSI|nr:hypothetical protein OIU77_025769 [Salix suchowensis]
MVSNGTTVPGYKPKTTCISLGEAAMDPDFILDPEGTTKGNLGSMNACSCESMCRLEIFWRVHSEVYFILIVVSVFLCFLLKRRMRFNILKHRQSPKRSVQHSLEGGKLQARNRKCKQTNLLNKQIPLIRRELQR